MTSNVTITFPHVTDIHSYLKLLYFKVGFFLRIILKSLCIPTMIAVIVFGQGSMSVLLHSGIKEIIFIYIFPGNPANFIQSGRRVKKRGGPFCSRMVNSRILFATT